MALLTVTRDPDGKSGILNIDAGLVLMLNFAFSSDKVTVHTADSVYFMVGTLKYWNKVLNCSGYRFEIVDRSNAMNLDKVKVLDKTLKIAFFEQTITKKSKRCMIASYRFKEVADHIRSFNPTIVIA
ncbi:LytTR family transcriptional regulator DNA-binding domain-containing protein [Paenibacillus graminis]|uniref:LytTR family transcriptional regulator DNA-binding domain-containing protein n=1 Tax=Paenibacillus graminis TaxID=189425 RepID=UPI002DB761C8|nr:hypothetical protein [Paenibacillus graminis]MEC0167420.1 LytTR family transcriptional regulator DNA-binding domain-containing protein [Paenibacillus graminis]